MLHKIRSTVKYPTSIILNGASNLALELADSLLEQGGYVIIVDADTAVNRDRVSKIAEGSADLLTFVDHKELPNFEENLRRLDYIFYLGHELDQPLDHELSSQQFLEYSNFLDSVLDLSVKYEAKFLLTTSVKAHQFSMSNDIMDLQFGKKNDRKHAVYTEFELQKYAESLVVEYIEKVNLDARILRLGEVIGEGMDYVAKTPFAEMVLDAVNSKPLRVMRDGLNSEWYVHLLDAVYGLVKAQFSRNTTGQIYTLAYEDSITDLSLAYKIHDYELNAGEIEFVDLPMTVAPLKLYKPATNLSAIGWKPRVTIDDAVKQSLSGAKLFLATYVARQVATKTGSDSDKSIADKLKSFLKLARNSKDDGTGVASILEPQAANTEEKALAITKANLVIKQKKTSRNVTGKGRFTGFLWGLFLGMRKRIKPLADVTPEQFLFWVVLSFVGVVIYLQLISPLVVLAKDYFILDSAIAQLVTASDKKDWASIHTNVATIATNVNEANLALARLQPAATLLGQSNQYNATVSFTQKLNRLVDAYNDLLEAIKPLENYLNTYTDNVYLRPNTESYLGLDQGTDYKEFIDQISSNAASAIDAQAKINSLWAEIKQANTSQLPGAIAAKLNQMQPALEQAQQFAELATVMQIAPEILSPGKNTTVGVLFTDNARYRMSGGDIAAYGLITMNGGSVIEVKLQSLDQIPNNLEGVPEIYFDLANNNRLTSLSSNQFTWQEFNTINSFADYAEVYKLMLEKTFNRGVDILITCNLNCVEGLIKQQGITVNVENINFDGSNVLANLQNLQAGNTSQVRRHDIIAQLAAGTLEKLGESMKNNYFNIASEIGNLYKSNDLQVVAWNKRNLANVLAKNANAEINVSASLSADPRIVTPDKYPTVNLQNSAVLQPDGMLNVQTRLRYPNLLTVDDALICLPLGASGITVGSDFREADIKITTTEQGKCVLLNVTSQTDIAVNWQLSLIVNPGNNQYNFALKIVNTPGLEIISDVELTTTDTWKIIQTDPLSNVNPTSAVFTDNLQGDKLIKFIIAKQ